MAALLSNLRNTMILSFIIALIIIAGYYMHHGGADVIFWQALFRWLHVVFGIVIGTYSSIYIAAPVILLWGVKRGEEEAEPIKPQPRAGVVQR